MQWYLVMIKSKYYIQNVHNKPLKIWVIIIIIY
jgi:hypothetical protein